MQMSTRNLRTTLKLQTNWEVLKTLHRLHRLQILLSSEYQNHARNTVQTSKSNVQLEEAGCKCVKWM